MQLRILQYGDFLVRERNGLWRTGLTWNKSLGCVSAPRVLLSMSFPILVRGILMFHLGIASNVLSRPRHPFVEKAAAMQAVERSPRQYFTHSKSVYIRRGTDI